MVTKSELRWFRREKGEDKGGHQHRHKIENKETKKLEEDPTNWYVCGLSNSVVNHLSQHLKRGNIR